MSVATAEYYAISRSRKVRDTIDRVIDKPDDIGGGVTRCYYHSTIRHNTNVCKLHGNFARGASKRNDNGRGSTIMHLLCTLRAYEMCRRRFPYRYTWPIRRFTRPLGTKARWTPWNVVLWKQTGWEIENIEWSLCLGIRIDVLNIEIHMGKMVEDRRSIDRCYYTLLFKMVGS